MYEYQSLSYPGQFSEFRVNQTDDMISQLLTSPRSTTRQETSDNSIYSNTRRSPWASSSSPINPRARCSQEFNREKPGTSFATTENVREQVMGDSGHASSVSGISQPLATATRCSPSTSAEASRRNSVLTLQNANRILQSANPSLVNAVLAQLNELSNQGSRPTDADCSLGSANNNALLLLAQLLHETAESQNYNNTFSADQLTNYNPYMLDQRTMTRSGRSAEYPEQGALELDHTWNGIEGTSYGSRGLETGRNLSQELSQLAMPYQQQLLSAYERDIARAAYVYRNSASELFDDVNAIDFCI